MEQLITNKILAIQNDSHSQNLGLFVGDMGICLALHLMNRTYNIPQAEAEADKLLKHIYENLKHLQNTGFKNGLSGIGWALCILKGQSCIEGNIDEILLNIDAVIYKSLTDIKYNVDINLLDGLIGNLIYLVERIRISGHDPSFTLHKLLVKALIISINRIFENTPILIRKITKDLRVTALSEFPILLTYLKKARSINVYSYKIDSIIQYWCHSFSNISPYYETNKLALAISLAYYNKNIDDELIKNCSDYLLYKIDYKRVEKEIDCQILNIQGGWIFTLFLLQIEKNLLEKTKVNNVNFDRLRKRIVIENNKTFISLLKSQEPANISFINGLSGIAVLYALFPTVFEDFTDSDYSQEYIDYFYGKRSYLK